MKSAYIRDWGFEREVKFHENERPKRTDLAEGSGGRVPLGQGAAELPFKRIAESTYLANQAHRQADE